MEVKVPADRGDCPFCRRGGVDALHAREHAFAVLDGFPVSPGHSLVIPRQHAACLFDLPKEIQAEVWRLVAQVRLELLDRLQPQGFTIGINDGAVAGQTVPHAHVHVIPRFAGDVPDPRGGIRWVVPQKAAYWRRDP